MKFISLIISLLVAYNGFCQTNQKLMSKGRRLLEKEKYEKALEKFQEAYNVNPGAEEKFEMAFCYQLLKNHQKSKELLLDVVTNHKQASGYRSALINLGNSYLALEQKDSAVFYYDLTIKEYPKEPAPYFYKGNILFYEGHFKDARELYNMAIDLDSDNWMYIQKRSMACFSLEDFECALRDLKISKALHPEIDVSMNLSYCYSMLQMYEQADSVFQEIYDENDPYILNNYGLNKHYLGDTKKAIELINKSIALWPENPYTYRNLALIAIDQGESEKVCEYLDRAKELHFKRKYGDEVDRLIIEHCSGN